MTKTGDADTRAGTMTALDTPPVISNAERLRSLRRLGVLDTAPEADFDDMAQLAAEICGTPVALVSLVEEDRQWFKATVGTCLDETPIDQAICVFTLAEGEFLEIPDTRADSRTADNPLCLGEDGFRFYAGAPLVTREGSLVGTLCVLDRRTRTLDAFQRKVLTVLARQIVAQLELRQALNDAATLRQEIDHRVKNSLQSLSSLARVEAAMATSPETKAALTSLDSRINTIALVHDQLYHSGAVSTVELQGYLENLAGYLRQIAPANVQIDTDFCRIVVNSRKAAALGMLVNEVVSNALKHGFSDGRAGRIDLSTTVLGDGRIAFSGRDNGAGLSVPAPGSDSVGMKIAQAMSAQLGGVLEVTQADPGVSVAIAFSPRG